MKLSDVVLPKVQQLQAHPIPAWEISSLCFLGHEQDTNGTSNNDDVESGFEQHYELKLEAACPAGQSSSTNFMEAGSNRNMVVRLELCGHTSRSTGYAHTVPSSPHHLLCQSATIARNLAL